MSNLEGKKDVLVPPELSRARCSVLPMDSALLGLAAVPGTACTVLVFEQKISRSRNAIEFHAIAPLEALPCMRSNGIPLGWSLSLPVHTANCVQTRKDVVQALFKGP
jgi:hypothetical protein